MVVFKDPGSVPENWRSIPEEETLEAGTSYVGCETSIPPCPSSDGLQRTPSAGFCSKCRNGKPPRCHHCSVCKSLLWLRCLVSFVLSFNLTSCTK